MNVRSTLLRHGPGRVVAVLTAAAVLAAVAPAASLAQTAPSGPAPATLPSGPPAPASFAGDLTRIYDEATSVPPPPGSPTSPAMSSDAFHQTVASLTTDQLNLIYASNPTAWPQVISAVDAYAQSVAPIAAQAAATTGGPKPSAAPARPAEAGSPAPPVLFTPTPCPLLAAAGVGGAYQEIYSLNVAKGAVETSADLLETFAVGDGGDALLAAIAAVGPTMPIAVATILGFLLTEEGLSLVAAVLHSVADALEIPIDVVEFLLHRSIDSCQYDNGVAVVPVIDANAVATQNNVNVSYRTSQQNFRLDQAINKLLDDRTAGIITQLNTAQASLDQALRHSIEEALAGGNTTSIVSYELPASLGGYLDATPIGVQAIVTSTLSMMQTAKQPISPQASKNLTLANQALAAGQYKQAFVYYQTAYGLLVR